jgi:hypothetical protein
MGYEINISKNGNHHFATAERSLGYDVKKLKEVYKELKSFYTEDKGFIITVTQCNTISNPFDIEEEIMTNELSSGR